MFNIWKRTCQRINELENGPSSYRLKNIFWLKSRGFWCSQRFGLNELGPLKSGCWLVDYFWSDQISKVQVLLNQINHKIETHAIWAKNMFFSWYELGPFSSSFMRRPAYQKVFCSISYDSYSESIQFQVHCKKSHFVPKTYSGPNNCQPERQYCMSCQALSVIIKSISQYHSWSLISDSFKLRGSESSTSQLIWKTWHWKSWISPIYGLHLYLEPSQNPAWKPWKLL